ncbi:hypothetical protein [Enterobacter sp. KB-280D8]|uniref:hypothetical protein n=1 Tax=Enterobacter sp. KB-280D8 TaxID=3242495 RepID=UPI003529C33B
MSTITKERAQQIFLGNGPEPTASEERELARIALASLQAEAVHQVLTSDAWVDLSKGAMESQGRVGATVRTLYTAPPATVSVPDRSMFEKWWESEHGSPLDSWDSLRTTDGYCDDGIDGQFEAWNACRAAMLQGADNEQQRKAKIHDALCEKYNVESLADFVDWQRNHIAELEAAPPAPVGEGETAIMPDYPGYALTQRECFQAGKKAGLAEAGNSPVIPDGWVLVPVEPSEDMIIHGFESEPDESFSDDKEWEAYEAMSGCQQAAHRAKLCWAAMIAAAPKLKHDLT